MDYQEQLLPQYEKKKAGKDLNQTDISRVAEVVVVGLRSGEVSPEDAIRVACDFEPSVVAKIFEVAMKECGEEPLFLLAAAFLDNATVKENKSDFGLRRYLSVGAVLLKCGNLPLFRRVFVEAAKRAGSNDDYKRAAKPLQKDNGGKTLALLLSHTYSDWNEKELKWLNQWLAQAVGSSGSENERNNYLRFVSSNRVTPLLTGLAQTNGTPPPEKTAETSDTVSDAGTPVAPNPTNEEQRKETIAELYRRLGREIDRMSQREKQMQENSRQLDRESKEKDSKLELLKGEKDRMEERLHIAQMQSADFLQKLRLSESIVAQRDKRIASLEHELKTFSQVGEIKRGQELSAFKEELAHRLKNDYDDYRKLVEKPGDLNYYQALLDLIDGVFTILRRKDIIIDDSPSRE